MAPAFCPLPNGALRPLGFLVLILRPFQGYSTYFEPIINQRRAKTRVLGVLGEKHLTFRCRTRRLQCDPSERPNDKESVHIS